jgi:hypothetical protein
VSLSRMQRKIIHDSLGFRSGGYWEESRRCGWTWNEGIELERAQSHSITRSECMSDVVASLQVLHYLVKDGDDSLI